jgi:hypothetical protein
MLAGAGFSTPFWAFHENGPGAVERIVQFPVANP